MKNASHLIKVLENAFIKEEASNQNEITHKSYDEDGNYERFSQRVGDGAIPINDSRYLIPSEPEVPKA